MFALKGVCGGDTLLEETWKQQDCLGPVEKELM